MDILITGIHGFVGSNLVCSLKKCHTIYGVDIVFPDKDGVKKTFSWNELAEVEGMDAIVHLAGMAHDMKNEVNREEYFEVNVDLTKRVFDYFLNSDAKKFIFFSSVKAAADRVNGDVLTEDVVPHPVGPYGESKIAAEKYIQGRMSECEEKGKFVYIVRPCMIHGPGNKGNLNLLYNIVKKGFPWPLGAFENKRSFVSVDNVCFVVKKLIEESICSGIYHLADDEVLSTNELVRLIGEVLGKKVRIWHVNQDMMKGCARVGTWFGLPLNDERLRKLTENYVVSNRKIKTILGIEKMPVNAEEGMRRTIRSFINE